MKIPIHGKILPKLVHHLIVGALQARVGDDGLLGEYNAPCGQDVPGEEGGRQDPRRAGGGSGCVGLLQ